MSVATLDAICKSLGLEATAAQTAALLDFLALLERWNATYNLTAVRDPAAMLSQHLGDCLATVLPVRRAGGRRLLDVGSGGGLPGVVLAVMLPALEVTCVDAVGKKAAFVRQVSGALQLPNLVALHARVETMREPRFDIVASRAFATLADFARLTATSLAPDGRWMAMKGKVPDAELAALPDSIAVFHVEQLTVPTLDAERCLVWMRPAVGYARRP